MYDTGPLDFEPAHISAGEDVAGRPGRDRYVGESINATGEILTDVVLDSAGPCRGTDQSERTGGFGRDCPRAFKSGLNRHGVPEQVGGACNITECRFEPSDAQLDASPVQVKRDAAGAHEATTKAAAAQERGQVEEITANSATVRRGRQEADVTGQGPQIAGVIGEPFQLEGDAANRLSPN